MVFSNLVFSNSPSVTGHINHTTGQTPYPGVVSQQKTKAIVLFCVGEGLKETEKTKLGGEGRRKGNLGGTGGDENHDQNMLHEKKLIKKKKNKLFFKLKMTVVRIAFTLT